MGTTFALLQLAASVWLGSVLLTIVAFYWGARWAKIENVTLFRATWICITINVVNLLIILAFRWLAPAALPAPAHSLLLFLAITFAEWLLIAVLARASLRQAFWAWLPMLAPGVLIVLLIYAVVRPYVVESYISPTNAMAPTILGTHVVESCPTCQRPAFASPDGRLMICEAFHVSPFSPNKQVEQQGDRFVVWKGLKPRRFDLAAFRCPQFPDEVWLMRVVGLPGESVELKDWGVSINGQSLTLPPDLAGVRYLEELPSSHAGRASGADQPARLGPDEYYVLGDFSDNAYDSRFWQKSVGGRPRYALPAENLVGVVTHIYWPPHRSRILR